MFLETDLVLDLGLLDDLVQNRSNLRVQHLIVWKLFPPTDREDLNSSNESTISTSSIHNIASDGKSQQVVTSFLNLIFQQKKWSGEFVELQLRYLLSLLSIHEVLRYFHRCRQTHGRRPSRKHRPWNCAFILLVISCERGPCSYCSWN